MAFRVVGCETIDYSSEPHYTAGEFDYQIIKSTYLMTFECDTELDLPTPIGSYETETVHGTINYAMGSSAHCIGSNKVYMINSQGTWCEQSEASRMDVYTTGQVNQLLQDMSDAQANVDLAQDADINANTDALKALVDSGAKNLIQMTHSSGSITRYGVTCTWDTDAGTMTLTGSHTTADNPAIFEFYSGNAVDQKVIPAGKYHISGTPVGGSTSTYRAALTSISGAVDTGSGADFTLTEPMYAAYRILISGNCDFTGGLVFRPMVTYQDYYKISPAFVPYAPTNAELYNLIKSYHP